MACHNNLSWQFDKGSPMSVLNYIAHIYNGLFFVLVKQHVEDGTCLV